MAEAFAAAYAGIFYVTVIALAGLELLPRVRRQTVHLARRWPTNIALFALNTAILWICVPVSVVAAAGHPGSHALTVLPADAAIGIILGVLLLDLWKYLEHRLMHRVTALWRFHLVHHSDVEVDFTTAERHHPIEAAISAVSLYALIYMIAVPPLAVVIFVLTGTIVALVSHANLRLPASIDRALRWVVVTPSMHLIHHSAWRAETDSNYGTVFTVWDRLFGTYRDHLAAEIPKAVLGLELFRATGDARLDRVLWQPVAYGTAGSAQFVERKDPTHTGWTHALAGIALALAVLVVAFQGTAMELVSIWSGNVTYSYAWLVLPALAYLLWHHRARFASSRPTWSLLGIAGAGMCGVAWLAADLANISVGRQIALVAAIPCIVLSAVGSRIFARLAPFLALLILLVPSGDVLLEPLKTLTVNIVRIAAALARAPYSFDGQVIFIGANRYVVVDDCAGLPYVLTTLFLGLTFGLLVYRSAWKIGLFALLGVVCGILANGVRVVSIVMLGWMEGTQLEWSSHVFLQWMAFALSTAIMVVVLMRVTAERQEAAIPSRPGQDAGAGRRSLMAALGAAALAISISQIGTGDAQAASRAAGNLLPERLAGWTRTEAATDWSPMPRTPMPHALARYKRGDREIDVFVAAAEQPRQKVTGYAVDLVGSVDWLEGKRLQLPDCSTSRCREVRVLELDRHLSDDVRRVYYVYTVGGRTFGSPLALQVQSAWNGLIGAPRLPRVIAVASDGKSGLSAADVAEALDALVSGD